MEMGETNMKHCEICNCTIRTSRKVIRKQGCQSCIDKLNNTIETTRLYKLKNSDKITSQLKEWRVNNQEYILSYREKYRLDNTDKLREDKRKYRTENKDKINSLNAKRRASKLNRIPKWSSNKDKVFISALYNMSQRLTKCLNINHHVDHIIPLQGELVSGLHVPSNLQVITEFANLSKHNKYQG